MNRKISPVGLMALDAVLQTQVAQGYLSEVQYGWVWVNRLVVVQKLMNCTLRVKPMK